MKISGAIVTYNEQNVLRRALESLTRVCDEIILVDSFSTDKTQQIAKEYNCKTIEHEFDNHRDQKNRAIEACSNNWILLLDADEYLNNRLANSIQEIIKNADQLGVDAVGTPRFNILDGGGPLGWPDIQTRLFRNYVRHAGHPFHHSSTFGAKKPILLLDAGYIIHDKTSDRQKQQNRLYYSIRPGDYKTPPDGAEDIKPDDSLGKTRLDVNVYQEYLKKLEVK
jgi:glycosyltransferase involved in cell wall biosynthesis